MSVITNLGNLGKGLKSALKNATGSFGGLTSWLRGLAGQGTDWDRKNFDAQYDWAHQLEGTRISERNEDIQRQERWRDEDKSYNSPSAVVQRLKEAGLHPALAGGAMGGGDGGYQIPQTSSGNRTMPTPVQDAGEGLGNPITMAGMLSQISKDRSSMAYQAQLGNLADAQAEETSANARFRNLEADDYESRVEREEERLRQGGIDVETRRMLGEAEITRIAQENKLDATRVRELEQNIQKKVRDNHIYNSNLFRFIPSDQNLPREVLDMLYGQGFALPTKEAPAVRSLWNKIVEKYQSFRGKK